MKNIYLRSLVVLILLGFISLSAFSTVRYVKPNLVSNAWQTKTNVYTSLQLALSESFSGDQIWLAEGVYLPSEIGDRYATFELKPNVQLYGGFNGTESTLEERNWQKHKVILSGDIGVTNDATDNSYTVVKAIGSEYNVIDKNCILNGVSIEGGYNNNPSWSERNGGGLFIDNASPFIANVVFKDNQSSRFGGALATVNGANPNIVNCFFINNQALNGGASYLSYDCESKFYNCLWYKNQVSDNYQNCYAEIYADGYDCLVTNSIVVLSDFNTSPKLTISGSVDLDNVLMSKDAGFVDIANYDFRLLIGSEAIDTGNIAHQLVSSTDYAGNARVLNETIDLGPFEGAVVVPVNSTPADQHAFVVTGETLNVTLQAEWTEAMPYTVERYFIEYWSDEENINSVDINSNLSYTTSFSKGKKVFWRLGLELSDGTINYSRVTTFSIRQSGSIYVKTGGTGDGSSWANAYGNLNEAINTSVDGDEIWIAAGVYKPSDADIRAQRFEIRNNITLYGGFAGNESALSERDYIKNRSIISGDIGVESIIDDNSLQLFRVNAEGIVVFDGLILQDVYAKDGSIAHKGGGMLVLDGDVTVRNCLVKDNQSYSSGAGISIQGGDVTVFNSIFKNNKSMVSYGGAISLESGTGFVVNCTFVGNVANGGSSVYEEGYNDYMKVYNCLSFNETNRYNDVSIKGDVDYSAFEFTWFNSSRNNMDIGDPSFVNHEMDDFRLNSRSPYIGKGSKEFVPEDALLDYYGNTRIQGDEVDMGAYEGGVKCPLILSPSLYEVIKTTESSCEIEFKAGWDGEVPSYAITQYFVEYWPAGGNKVKVVTESDLTTTLSLSAKIEYNWRAGVVLDNGIINYSPVSYFSIVNDQPIYVKSGANGDGSSWENAFGTMQEALSVAVEGDELWIAEGTYYPTDDDDRNVNFSIQSAIYLYGGFAGDETALEDRNWRSHPTIISGNIGDPLEEADNSIQLFKCSLKSIRPVVFDGLTLRDSYSYSLGGGIYSSEGASKVLNCIFEYNTAGQGSAIASEVRLECYNTIFRNNTSHYDDVIEAYDGENDIVNCVFVNNTSDRIIIGNGTVANSIFWNNKIESSATSNISVFNSCVQGRSSDEINSDPLFIDMENGDYRLHYLSHAIDAGDNEKLPEDITKDYYGNARLENNVDLGICEGGVLTPIIVYPKAGQIITNETASINVEFEWEWGTNVTIPDVESYSIEYWYNNGSYAKVDDISALKTSVTFDVGQKVEWRVIAHVKNEQPVIGLKRSFSLPHLHPIYVQEGQTGDGTSWASALGDVNEAIAMAVGGDELWVAAGTYKPAESDRYQSFAIDKSIAIYGGFKGTESTLPERDWQSNPTIFSGNIGDLDKASDNSSHVVYLETLLSDTTIIDGISITEGYANLWSTNNRYAGAIFAQNGVLFLRNTIVSDNFSDDEGGAIYNNGAHLYIQNSQLIHNNSSNSYGGALFHNNGKTQVLNSVVYANKGGRGGGVASYNSNNGLEVVNSIIWGNTGYDNSDDVYGVKARYSILGQSYDGDGNIVASPLFIDADNKDFRLNITSLGIDAGVNDSIPIDMLFDLAGKDRIINDVVDMGCFEGGVITPMITNLSNDSIVKGVFLGTDVTFEWQWPEGYAVPEYDHFRLEYWTTEDNVISVDAITELSHTVALDNGNEYQWRVVAVNGEETYPSPIGSFVVTHEYAIKVKEGSSGWGDRWAYAFGSLQAAIDEAVRGDEIWIAEGTYFTSTTDDRDEFFRITKGLTIYGGFKGNEVYLEDRSGSTEKTILSADIGLAGAPADNSYRVIETNFSKKDTLIIDGLTITGGQGDNIVGGGVFHKQGYLVLNNTVVRNNYAANGGGVTSRGFTEIINSLITNNNGDFYGGIYANENEISVYNSTVVNNRANNSSVIYANYKGKINLFNCILWNNTSNDASYDYYLRGKLYNSCIPEGSYNTSVDEMNSVHIDPLFVDAENANYRLKITSPCINNGSNDYIPEQCRKDLDGIGRVSWGLVDMGAYEASYPKQVRPADKTPERPTGVLGYTWTLGADIDGVSPNPNLMDTSPYSMSFKVWDVDDEDNVYEEYDGIGYWGFMSFNYEHRKGYQWRVGVQTESYTYWSDTATFYVGGETPLHVKLGSSGDGTSWDKAYGSIQEALDNSIKGDEIWVANGEYTVSASDDKTESLMLGSYRAIYGGFEGNETQRGSRYSSKGKTIISGDIGTKGSTDDNTNTLIKVLGTSEAPVEGVLIDGVTLTSANAEEGNGGALYAKHANYKLLNCFVSDNAATNGAAVYNTTSEAFIYNTQIDNNKGAQVVFGDAASNLTMVNATVTANSGGVQSPGNIINTIIYANEGTQLSEAAATYSCIEGGYDGVENVSGDPDFIDVEERDYRLGMYSSCFDQGDDLSLPGYAYMDLHKNERRTFYSQVDIGAFEIGVYQLGKVEVTGSTPTHESSEVDYSTHLKIAFNKPIKDISRQSITISPNAGYLYPRLNESGDTLIIWDYDKELDFDQTYTVDIPSEAVQFVNNSKIPTEAVHLQFSIRSCKPAVIKPEQTTLSACLFADIDLLVELEGDYLENYTWMAADTVYKHSYYESQLWIHRFTEDKAGTFTMVVNDMCDNVVTKDVVISPRSSSEIVLKDKWDDILFIDNSQQNFSDYTWYVNNQEAGDAQYLNLVSKSGEVYVTATDLVSGCTVYSDTLELANGGLKNVKVMPNPVQRNQNVVIKLPEQKEKTQVRLYSMGGSLVAQHTYENTFVIDYEHTNVKPGVYILEVQSEGLIEKRKIIIQK
ncbi:choice-of-anchor Q domain-containing protein [Carboxylicivirga sp. M1479]|uniref:choice-of-anchor Q domain-containing protein n=1 Tax=Carboxylicivirga sp. M1479 TaxID=2594476 RepID=UPI001177F0D4|nr:choice-of-anchor Q domain-containing protein [Carboxylicivirga sp. M1479]TRX66449.1 T9SS type A sorting domain-containing protein [Carboxylicivirga sp. M1479]